MASINGVTSAELGGAIRSALPELYTLREAAKILRCGQRIIWMPACHRVNTFEPFAKGNCSCAAFEISADADDAPDARGVRAFDDLRQVGRKVREVEVGVSVEELRHTYLARVL